MNSLSMDLRSQQINITTAAAARKVEAKKNCCATCLRIHLDLHLFSYSCLCFSGFSCVIDHDYSPCATHNRTQRTFLPQVAVQYRSTTAVQASATATRRIRTSYRSQPKAARRRSSTAGSGSMCPPSRRRRIAACCIKRRRVTRDIWVTARCVMVYPSMRCLHHRSRNWYVDKSIIRSN